MFKFFLPTRVIIGKGVLKTLPDHIHHRVHNVILVSSNDIKMHYQIVEDYLKEKGIAITKILMEEGEPSCDFIDKTSAELKNDKFEYIIGIGGGSAVDMAKALSIAIVNPEPIWNYANLSNRPPSPINVKSLPVIAIPTTAGTGSEVTPYAVLTNNDTNQKGTIQDITIFPQYAIIDPELHVTLPSHLTSTTGIDVFAHAFEAYINISKLAPVAEWASAEAIRLVFKNLGNAYSNPENDEARMQMAWASTLAGIAIAHRGTTTPHAIAEPLSALKKIPHGLSVSLCSLPVLRATWKSIPEVLENLAQKTLPFSLGVKGNAKSFVNTFEKLLIELKIPKALSKMMAVEDEFEERLLNNVLQYKFRPLKQHPVEFDKYNLKMIINEIINGKEA